MCVPSRLRHKLLSLLNIRRFHSRPELIIANNGKPMGKKMLVDDSEAPGKKKAAYRNFMIYFLEYLAEGMNFT